MSRSATELTRTVSDVLFEGTCGGRETATPGAFFSSQLLNRESLLGPSMGKVKLYLKLTLHSFNSERIADARSGAAASCCVQIVFWVE